MTVRSRAHIMVVLDSGKDALVPYTGLSLLPMPASIPSLPFMTSSMVLKLPEAPAVGSVMRRRALPSATLWR